MSKSHEYGFIDMHTLGMFGSDNVWFDKCFGKKFGKVANRYVIIILLHMYMMYSIMIMQMFALHTYYINHNS